MSRICLGVFAAIFTVLAITTIVINIVIPLKLKDAVVGYKFGNEGTPLEISLNQTTTVPLTLSTTNLTVYRWDLTKNMMKNESGETLLFCVHGLVGNESVDIYESNGKHAPSLNSPYTHKVNITKFAENSCGRATNCGGSLYLGFILSSTEVDPKTHFLLRMERKTGDDLSNLGCSAVKVFTNVIVLIIGLSIGVASCCFVGFCIGFWCCFASAGKKHTGYVAVYQTTTSPHQPLIQNQSPQYEYGSKV